MRPHGVRKLSRVSNPADLQEDRISAPHGRWVDRIVGLEGVRTDFAFMQTPDGLGRLELIKFHSPAHRGDKRHAPANTPGIRHLAFVVDNIDAVVARLRARGAELVGEVPSLRAVISFRVQAARLLRHEA